MAIRKQLHDVLTLIAELGHNNRYIHELESLGLIRIQPRMNGSVDEKGREFRLINITREGLRELSEQTLR